MISKPFWGTVPTINGFLKDIFLDILFLITWVSLYFLKLMANDMEANF